MVSSPYRFYPAPVSDQPETGKRAEAQRPHPKTFFSHFSDAMHQKIGKLT
ncbi:hypothetical protein APA386B_2433 [Acetobacter pasteurianus 386B]|nr:hypothetical protein APA386B_2433 [Acetobacter pasteurianus 386B]